MKLIFIYGFPAVGKLTVARELARLTKFPLFHNHLVVDVVLSLFEFGTPPFVELREKIWLDMFKKASEVRLPGLIFTFAFDRSVTRAFIGNLQRAVEANDGEILFVELTCESDELEKRITDPSRQKFGKLSSLEQYRELNAAGAFVDPGIPRGGLSIDVTTREPRETAKLIAQGLNLVPKIHFETEASVRSAYDDWSNTYDTDTNRTRDLDAQVTRKLLGGEHFESVLEFGCGTGKNTIFLAEVATKVLAMDFSGAMLELAREKVRERELTNVIFREADITKPWPFESESADLVTCNLILEHVSDLSAIFSEAARCLVKGGRLFVSELHPFRQYEGTKARFERDGAMQEIDAFVHHASDFIRAGEKSDLKLLQLNEWGHEEDVNNPPRLITFLFKRQ